MKTDENLYSPGQRIISKKGWNNWDEIFKKKEKPISGVIVPSVSQDGKCRHFNLHGSHCLGHPKAESKWCFKCVCYMAHRLDHPIHRERVAVKVLNAAFETEVGKRGNLKKDVADKLSAMKKEKPNEDPSSK